MDYHKAYYILWKEENDKVIKLQKRLDELMASYEQSIEIQKRFLKELTAAKQGWCCFRKRQVP